MTQLPRTLWLQKYFSPSFPNNNPVYTLNEIARHLNRPPLYLRGLQQRFGLDVLAGSGYSEAYRQFLKTLVQLRALGVNEDTMVKMWSLEKKLLQLLHVDALGSPTWYLDSCGRKNHRRRRLLLSNHDLGVCINSAKIQLHMNFSERHSELFDSAAMGEDVIQVLDRYQELYRRVKSDVLAEARLLSSAAGWAQRFKYS